jgi:hypothetical protein
MPQKRSSGSPVRGCQGFRVLSGFPLEDMSQLNQNITIQQIGYPCLSSSGSLAMLAAMVEFTFRNTEMVLKASAHSWWRCHRAKTQLQRDVGSFGSISSDCVGDKPGDYCHKHGDQPVGERIIEGKIID